MTFFLGVDVAKLKLDVCLCDEHGRPIWYDQTPNDMENLAGYLLALQVNHPDVTLAVEPTAALHYPLLYAAHACGVPCRVFNPILTRGLIRASVRGKKTDKTDALVIARLGLRGEGHLHEPEPFPEAKYLARSSGQFAAYDGILAKHTQHVDAMLDAGLSPAASACFAEVRAALRRARRQLQDDMKAAAPPELSTLLQTVPGIGPYTAATLLGEIGDIRRFSSGDRLVAFAGLDPRIRQSGTALNHSGHLTKRGSRYLRRALFMAASGARRSDPYFRAYYERKRKEGRTYTETSVVLARKVLLIARAVWISGKEYNPADAGLLQRRG